MLHDLPTCDICALLADGLVGRLVCECVRVCSSHARMLTRTDGRMGNRR